MRNEFPMRPAYAGIFLLLLIFIFLSLRNTGLYPSVFADEYTYSKLSRLQPLSESPVPGYLYLKLYGLTNHCGEGFLGCAKLINSFLFVSALPFIYLSARRVADQGVSALISLLALIGPISSYTAYFMPESFYFFSFWLFCWYFLGLSSDSKKWQWILAGVIYAISMLIKPHSIFFLPATIIYIFFLLSREYGFFCKQSCLCLASFLFGALLTKFGLSYILAGSSGLTIFGPLYSSIALSTVNGIERYIQLLPLTFESLKGHIFVMALLYGLPIVLCLAIGLKTLFSREYKSIDCVSLTTQHEKLVLFSLFVIINLICVVTIFTASVANLGPYESPYRLHMRYYNFALPLFYLVAAGALSMVIDVNRPARYILGGIFVAIGFFALWTNLAPYTPSYIDSPEVRGLHVDRLHFLIIGGLLVSAVALWLVSQKKGLLLYLYFALPLSVVVSTYNVGSEQSNRLVQDIYDKAGIFTKQFLTNEDLSKVVIVGSEAGGIFRSLFYLDNAKASLEIIKKGADFDLAKLPTDKEWVLVIGDHTINGTTFYQIQMNGFSLIRVSEKNVLELK